WIDDAPSDPESIALAGYLRARPPRSPVLVLMTAREDAFTRELQALATTRIPVAPLPPADGLALAREILPLDDILCRTLADRTFGNPLFALQLVGDWVARGTLVAGPRGFRLADGARPELPD